MSLEQIVFAAKENIYKVRILKSLLTVSHQIFLINFMVILMTVILKYCIMKLVNLRKICIMQ